MSKGFMDGVIGDVVFANRLRRPKLKEGERTVISILSQKIQIVKIHYDESIRYIYCTEGLCCQKFGMPDVRYVFPCLMYDVDKKGNIIPESDEWKVFPLSLGYKEYRNMMTKNEITGDITKHDLMVTCQAEQYQTWAYETLGECKWKKIPAITNRIKEEVAYYQNNLKSAIARELTDNEIIAALAKVGGAGSLAIDKPSVDDAPVASIASAPAQAAPQRRIAQAPKAAPAPAQAEQAPAADTSNTVVSESMSFDELFQ